MLLKHLRTVVSEDVFKNWFRELTVLGKNGTVLQVCAPNRYAKYWIESHYGRDLLNSAREMMPEVTAVELLVATPRQAPLASDSSAALSDVLQNTLPRSAQPATANAKVDDGPRNSTRPARDGFTHTPLASRLRLETFIVGKCTRVAHAAAQSVSESPAAVYNPLFIHGAHGLGKTHLLHGIGHLLRERVPPQNVMYVPCEEFTNHYVQAVQSRRLDAFRTRYRSCDALLIDDVQFLAGKDRTQEEFLHTFDTLRNSQKQIVIVCDTSPRDLKRIDPKLLTRFQSGLVAQVEMPEAETRATIVSAKAKLRGLSLPVDVAETISTHISSNVRELEGAVCKLMALAAAEGRSPDRELALHALRDLGYLRSGPLALQDILQAVSQHFGISADELRGDKRHAAIVHARHAGMYLSKHLTSKSVAEIGRFYGNRDHATVLHATRKLSNLVKRDEQTKEELEKLRQVLGR
jgi:chromosomal replication initiator protein